MLKRLILCALIALPLGVFAQELKIAHVNTQDVFNAMPETSTVESEMAKQNQFYTDELKRMQDEYQRKYTEFQQSDSLPESIKIRRMQEIEDIQQKIEAYYQESRQQLQKKQSDLLAPIQKKIMDAIKAVADENNYTYVMENGAFLYTSPKSIDATSLVKTKLGIK